MIIAIVGSRSVTDKKIVFDFIEACRKFDKAKDKIISGGASGVDTLAREFAEESGIEFAEIKPDWNRYGKKAGFLRNTELMKACDECICVWDGISKGSKHDIDLCRKYGKPYYLYNLKTGEKIFPEPKLNL